MGFFSNLSKDGMLRSEILLGIAVSLMLVLPFDFQFVKLLLLLLFIALRLKTRTYLRVSGDYYYWFVLYLLGSFIQIIMGYIYGNPAPSIYIPVAIMWPILYFIVFSCIELNDFNNLDSFFRLSFAIILILSLFSFLYFNITFTTSGKMFGFDASIRPGFPLIAISGPSVTSALYLWSYIYVQYLFKRKKTDLILLILGVVFVFVTSRRAMYLVIGSLFLLSPLMINLINYTIKSRNYRIKINKKIFGWAGIVIILLSLILSHFDLVSFSSMSDFFKETSDKSDAVRFTQADKLIEAWEVKPAFGWGVGVDAPGCVRSDLPGTYELGYHALLFRAGLVGISCYVFLMFWANYRAIKVARHSTVIMFHALPIVVACLTILFLDSTNPYSSSFDFIWTIFLPISFVNSIEMYTRSNN